ncbi:MAG: hypothetical protein ACPGED_11600, partial [Flavobacteriales bacterium]
IIYRYSTATKAADLDFGVAQIGKGVRCPNDIIHHMSDIIIGSLKVCETGTWKREKIEVGNFDIENALFITSCLDLLDFSKQNTISEKAQSKLIQGPLSDILTHIGQLSMISRLVSEPVEGQNYSQVDIDAFIDGLSR